MAVAPGHFDVVLVVCRDSREGIRNEHPKDTRNGYLAFDIVHAVEFSRNGRSRHRPSQPAIGAHTPPLPVGVIQPKQPALTSEAESDPSSVDGKHATRKPRQLLFHQDHHPPEQLRKPFSFPPVPATRGDITRTTPPPQNNPHPGRVATAPRGGTGTVPGGPSPSISGRSGARP